MESYRRTNEPSGLEVEPSTAGATSAGDLEDGPEWNWISTWPDDADFILESQEGRQTLLKCRQCNKGMFTVGSMELWEFVIDAGRHYIEEHQ